MKKLFVCLNLIALLTPAVAAAREPAAAPAGVEITGKLQQNLIGEVSAIDPAGGKITILTDAKASVTVTFDDKTILRRVAPGQTSLANAETIKIADVKVGDRILVPGYVAGESGAVRQIVVMPRAALEKTQQAEVEKRRARTVGGRITALNAEKKEITLQTRGRANPETLTVALAGSVKLLRYAPDSLKLSDAVAGSFTDLKVGDQIRVVGDRDADGTRVTAEEIISGSVSRSVGTVSEINPARGEVVIKNNQTGQIVTVAIGKNTTLRRITPEVAATLKERFERRNARRRERNADQQAPAQNEQPRNRERRRNQTGDGQTNNNNNRRQLFDNLPTIALADLKKGDAVLITGTNPTGGAGQMTAVSIIAADGDLQQILLRSQGGRGGNSSMSPGLPGNVSGGNAASDDDDEPER